MKRNVSLPIYVCVIFCIILNACLAEDTRKFFNGVSVVVKVTYKTPRGMHQYRINKEALTKHFKDQLAEILMSTQHSISFRPTDPHLIIDITIKGDNSSKKYYIITVASLDDGLEEWDVGFSDYWNKEKNLAPVRRYEEYIKRTKKILALGNQVVGYGSSSSEVEDIYKGKVEELKDDLAEAEKMLAEAEKKTGITYTIKQSLSSIAAEFSKYYLLARQYEQEYTRQATETEELRDQLGEGEAAPPQQEINRYTELRSPAGKNVLYETGSIIKLHNQADTAVAIYKDESLSNLTNLFSNGIKATIIDYKALRDKSVVYKVRILLQDGDEYVGWVPEGVISGAEVLNYKKKLKP